MPAISVIANCGGGSMKSQMKKADRSGARLALILGEEELNNGVVTVKYLRDNKEQLTVALDSLESELDQLLNLD